MLFAFVSDVPDAPGEVELSEQKERSVRLSWTAGSDHNSSVTGTTRSNKSLLFSRQEGTVTALEKGTTGEIKYSIERTGN